MHKIKTIALLASGNSVGFQRTDNVTRYYELKDNRRRERVTRLCNRLGVVPKIYIFRFGVGVYYLLENKS